MNKHYPINEINPYCLAEVSSGKLLTGDGNLIGDMIEAIKY